MHPQATTADERIAEIAATAHGVVAYDELIDAKVTRDQIRARRERGSLIRIHAGVYRVGHAAPSREATYMAAVKAGGKEAVLSGRAAAHLLGVLKGAPPPPEITAPTKRRIKGVRSRCRELPPTEITTHSRIRCTTPARTLVDLAGTLKPHLLSRVVHEAQIRHDLEPQQIEAILQRQPNAPGAKALRSIVMGDAPTTLSKLEQRFLEVLEQSKLPTPQTNRRAGGRHVDCRWPDKRLTVELDSYRFHNSRHTWELDRRREREAYARGDAFRRYTWRDVNEQPKAMLRELRELLG